MPSNLSVALLGYGRQGKKHREALETYGITPEIFTRENSRETKTIRSFHPNAYTIIIVAISPIEEQTKVLEMILESGYKNILIIEKPITFSSHLLTRLTKRKYTHFFIDEIYLQQYNGGKIPKNIHTTSKEALSQFALIEHAIGNILSGSVDGVTLSSIEYSHTLADTLSYTLSFSGTEKKFHMELQHLNFSQVYASFMKKMHDEAFLEQVRENYLLFRSLPEFREFFY